MIVRLFGILDLLAALSLLLVYFGIGKTFALVIFTLLFIKSFVFFSNVVSIIDIVAILFFVLTLFGFSPLLTWLAFAWLTQKGILSMVRTA